VAEFEFGFEEDCGGLGWTDGAVVACHFCGGTGRLTERALLPRKGDLTGPDREKRNERTVSDRACVLAWLLTEGDLLPGGAKLLSVQPLTGRSQGPVRPT
jgi:hypothetical protein